MKKITSEKTLIIFTVLIGIFLSMYQFIQNRSLWLDESYLSLNIIHKSPFELLKPLDLGQVAPILFLEIEKVFSIVIPNSEFGLRLFPMISFSISLLLFYKIVNDIHHNYYTIIFSLALFVFNPTLINYSVEVKQYSTDVLVLTCLYFFALKIDHNDKLTYYYLGIIGTVSIFISNVAPIILFTVCFYLIYSNYINKHHNLFHIAIISLVWGCSFLLYYVLFIYKHIPKETLDYFITSWGYYNGFMPTDPFKIQFYQFIRNISSMIFTSLFRFGKIGGISLIILFFTGILSLIKNRKIALFILTITPLILHLLLSALKLYPFDTRLILYTCPCIIIICSFGFDYFVNILFNPLKIGRLSILALCIPLLLFYCFYLDTGLTMKKYGIKESIIFIGQHINKNDKLFVSYFASWPFRYYRDIGFIKTDSNNIIYGNINKITWNGKRWIADTIQLSNELSLLGGRVWFLFVENGDEDERMQFVNNYYKLRGKNIIQEYHTRGSDVYLYKTNN